MRPAATDTGFEVRRRPKSFSCHIRTAHGDGLGAHSRSRADRTDRELCASGRASPPVEIDVFVPSPASLTRCSRPGAGLSDRGSTAVLEGWRSRDRLDLRSNPRPTSCCAHFRPEESLGVNIELASPPTLSRAPAGGSVARSCSGGERRVHNFDLYSQALSKIERGFDQDLDDVQKIMASGCGVGGYANSTRRSSRSSIAIQRSTVRIPAEARPVLAGS